VRPKVKSSQGKETKVEAFEHLELFQVGRKRQSSGGAQLSSDSAEEIWTVEDFMSREQWKSAQSRRDSEPLDLAQIADSRQICREELEV
jgi:hypothetical protein